MRTVNFIAGIVLASVFSFSAVAVVAVPTSAAGTTTIGGTRDPLSDGPRCPLCELKLAPKKS